MVQGNSILNLWVKSDLYCFPHRNFNVKQILPKMRLDQKVEDN